MRKALTFVAGVVIGIAASLAGFLYVASSAGDSAENRFAQTMADRNNEDQAKLGMQCSEGTEFVRNYLNSLTPVMVKLQRGERVLHSDPLIAKGEQVREVLLTCNLAHNNAMAGRIPSPTPIGLVNGQAYVSAITLTVAQSAADWCEAKCIKDSLVKLQELRDLATYELAKTGT